VATSRCSRGRGAPTQRTIREATLSYVNYDLSLYRQGYRPYGETDPFAATMLSGVKPTPAGHPFAPWRLRGMGQNPPFTESGGYKLHGLAGAVLGFLGDASIPPGAILTYKGTWTTVQDPQSLVNAVVSQLNGDGQLTVLQAPTSASIGATIANAIGMNNPFSVTLVLQVTNGMGFSSVNDVISIVRHYVYAVAGVFPQTDAITQVQSPSTAPNYQAAGVLNPGGFALPGLTSPSAAPDLTTWVSENATTLAIAGIGLLVAVPLLKRLF